MPRPNLRHSLAIGARSSLSAALTACLVLLATYAGVAPAIARADSPVLAQDTVITASAQAWDPNYAGSGGVNNGNGWAANGARITRASNGDLYTTYVSPNANSNLVNWTLAKQPASGGAWQTVTSGTAAKNNPPQVLRGPNDQIYVIALSDPQGSLGGAPFMWDSVSGQTQPIPGHWLTDPNCASGQLYCVERASVFYLAAGIDASGDIAFMQVVPCPFFTLADGSPVSCSSTNAPGTYNWAYRSASTGQWSSHQWQVDARQSYNFLFPTATSMTAVGTRDIQSSEAGNACGGSSGYCFDQVRWVNWPSLSGAPANPIVERSAQGSPFYAPAEDAYVDTSGNTHVIYSLQDSTAGGAWQGRHMIVAPNGTVLSDVASPVPYSNLSRVIQDASGRFWIYSVGPGANNQCTIYIAGGNAGDANGTSMGPATQLPLNENCGQVERNFDAAPRVGAKLTNTIDGVFATALGSQWVQYQLRLPAGSSTPPPPPPPATSPPTITTQSVPNATTGVAYSQPLAVSGGSSPYTWAINGAGPPPGISLSSSGTLSGTVPCGSATGTANIQVKVTDTSSPQQTATATIPLTVAQGSCGSTTPPASAPLTISTKSVPNATMGLAYSQHLVASGGSGTYTWSVYGAGPPAGFSLSANGTLSGTALCGHPTWYAQGTWGIQLQLVDTSNPQQTAQATIPLTVVQGACGSTPSVSAPLTISTKSVPNATIGVAYSQSLAASGGSGTYTWSVYGAGPPAGFSLSSSGVVSGTAACTLAWLYAQGTWDIQVQVTDSSSPQQTAQATIPLTMAVGTCGSTTSSLQVTTKSLPTETTGVWYSQNMSASGGSGTYTWSATGLPPGFWMASNGTLMGGAVCGNPSWYAQGTWSIQVSVTDTSQPKQTAQATIPLHVIVTC